MATTLVIGCGYIGKRIARLALERNDTVAVLVRDPEKGTEMEHAGAQVFSGNLDRPDSFPPLPTTGATVHYLVPPIGGGSIDTRVRIFCASIQRGQEPAKVIYMSTSGVYGDCGGAVVSEDSPANPQTSRARRRLDAENYLLSWGRETGVAVVILRVPGIYGPGRVPLAQIESGNPVLRENESPLTNRIHADDLAQVCLAAAERGGSGDIFNVGDGQCSTMTGYFNAVADEFGLMRPSQVSREVAPQLMNPLILSYFSESRCLDTTKMRKKLGVTLRYPTLEEGLKACRGPE